MVKLTFTHCMADIIELNRYAREKRMGGWVVTLFGVGFLTVELVQVLQGSPIHAFSLWCFAFTLLLGLFATRVAGIGAWFLKATTVPYDLRIDDTGVTFLDTVPNLVNWATFSRWFETPKLICIAKNGVDCLAIPKRCMTDEQLNEVRQILRRDLGEDAGW